MSTRNRLLSVPVGSTSTRIVQVFDELTEEVFRILINEKKSMSFLPGRGAKDTVQLAGANIADDSEEVGLPQPEDVEVSSTGLAKRHVDSKLQTSLSSEGLQRRLLDLFIDSKTMVEEQGVNILYLALGHLKWIEADDPDSARFAPLILIPVELERKTAAEKFCIKWREEDIEENLSLHAKLESDFGVNSRCKLGTIRSIYLFASGVPRSASLFSQTTLTAKGANNMPPHDE